ncbi:mannan endo-1,4-beta-mannosidase-like [Gigantopelta aegis]|uniref:mannan endo-1,4-beta-mannosidase-like n=1 Tax=Gigantopelta aegis TaxID=1735272 RepID=UPI001B88E78A|nr:mannan endo-1,4-beta-mannosidase-like [Gigantopelta aegis]
MCFNSVQRVFFILFCASNIIINVVVCDSFLTVTGTKLSLNNERVYLSGMNQAWVHYGADFGNGDYVKSRPTLIRNLDNIRKAGGNSMRIWLHVDGLSTPMFDANGYVTGLDKYIIDDLKDFLHEARIRNIIINIVLWNFARAPSWRLHGLVYNSSKLESYIHNALRPMVLALKDEPALGIWEIMNEPEGCVAIGRRSSNPCLDTTTLHVYDFADWTLSSIPLELLLVFAGRQISAIHTADNKALVTIGAWTYKSVATSLGRRNFYSDHCLEGLTNDSQAHLDLYEIHTYDTLHVYLPHDPFVVESSMYNLDKPVIIGEFSSKRGGGMTSPTQFLWGYYHGYSGTWSWCALDNDSASDNITVQERGMHSLDGLNNQSAGGRVNFIVNHDISIWDYLACALWTVFQFLWKCLG